MSAEIAVTRLHESPTNPRGPLPVLPNDKDLELVESVKRFGVELDLTVRPHPTILNDYEIVCGHRRWQAATRAGLKNVNCVIRELTDSEAAKLQLRELGLNEAVSPFAEAESYRKLVDEAKGDVAAVAKDLSKPIRYVYGRLALARVAPEVKKAAGPGGGLSIDGVRLLARLSEVDQVRALKAMPTWTSTWTEETVRRVIREEILLELAKAPFDVKDATFPGGACAGCPKRTGSVPDLFEAITDKRDTCTDSACWKKKAQHSWELRCAAAKSEGAEVLTAAQAKDVFKRDYQGVHAKKGSGFIDLAEKVEGDPKGRTVAQVLGKAALKKLTPTLARDEDNGVHELVKLKDVKPLLEEKVPAAAATSSGGSPAKREEPEDKAKREKERAKRELEGLVTQAAKVALVKRTLAGKPPLALLRQNLEEMLDLYDEDSRALFVVALGLKTSTDEASEKAFDKEVDSRLETASLNELLAALIAQQLGGYYTTGGPHWTATLKEAGVDLKDIEREVNAAQKAGVKAAKANKHFEAPSGHGEQVPEEEAEPEPRMCANCECTDEMGCDGGCSWIPGATKNGKLTDICSACADWADPKPAKKGKKAGAA